MVYAFNRDTAVNVRIGKEAIFHLQMKWELDQIFIFSFINFKWFKFFYDLMQYYI